LERVSWLFGGSADAGRVEGTMASVLVRLNSVELGIVEGITGDFTVALGKIGVFVKALLSSEIQFDSKNNITKLIKSRCLCIASIPSI
jgi:hypothetical protein